MRLYLCFLPPVLLLVYLATAGFVSSSDEYQAAPNRIDVPSHQILWSESDKLIWSDFKGRRDKRSHHHAVTTSSLQTQPIVFTQEKVQYELFALFDKKKSWTVSDSKALLAHEQVHFDISELVLRKMRKKFLEHNFKDLNGVNYMIDSTFEEASNERDRLNREYDKETNHSRNKEQQLEWQKRIEEEIEELSDYSSILVTITK